MPAIARSGSRSNATRCEQWDVAPWAGKAGAVQQLTALQFAIRPLSWPPGHPGQACPEAMPGLVAGCICIMAAADAT